MPAVPKARLCASITAGPVVTATPQSPEPTGHRHRSHGWMMMICCIPMLVIAVALVATGTVGAGFLLTALLCTAVMALMMGGMNHG